MITIVSLGTEKGELTARALKALKSADEVLVRNAQLPSAESLVEEGIPFADLTEIYRKSRNFDTLAKNLAEEVVRRAKGISLCYCVDGGVCEDRAAQILLSRKDVRAIEGVTKSAKAASLAGICGGYRSVSAYEIAEGGLSLPLVVYDLDDRNLAGDVKLLLGELFGDESTAFFVSGGKAERISLYEADRQKEYGADTALVLPAQPLLGKKRFTLEDLMEILRLLRAPDGCPWDRVQTHESIRINAIEEAYELVDAIDEKDPDKMCEEAGDVLMQAAFHTLIEEERGNFTMTDVLSGVCEKLITRHTHVFGKDRAAGADGALTVWEKNKMTEKHQERFSDAVNDVPQCFPALLRAQKIAKRVGKGGWDFSSFEKTRAKLEEECDELKKAYERGDKEEIAAELGDVLMCTAWLGRAVGADCEQALLDAVKKIQRRYTAFESLVLADGKDVNALSQEEWQGYYRRAKEDVEKA